MAPLRLRIDEKRYRNADGSDRLVLRGLELDVPDREVVALLGPSGCGKTTTLNIIAGLDDDLTGEIDRGGAERIGFVFQEPRLLPWRTVIDNIRLVTGWDAAAEPRIRNLLERTGLAADADRYPGELSLGMARRAALVRALAVEPEILLLDEPFASLDQGTAARMHELLASLLAERPVTTLLVTHDPAEADHLADRIALLSPPPASILSLTRIPGRTRGLKLVSEVKA